MNLFSPSNMVRLPAVALALVLLFGSGCDSESMMTPDPDANLPAGDGTIQIGGFQKAELSGARFELLGARFEGNAIELQVAYSGGCMEHGFRMFADEAVALSMPPQLAVYVVHDDPGDMCEAYPHETVRVDVTPLMDWLQSPFVVHVQGINSPSDVITISYSIE